MKLATSALLAAVVVAAACSTAPTPVDIQAPFWQGNVAYSLDSSQAGVEDKRTLAGPVTWIKDEAPEPAPLAGGVSYIIQSGSLILIHRAVSGSCTIEGTTTLTLKPGDGSLVLSPDGTYAGSIHSVAPFVSTWSCPGPGADPSVWDAAPIDLEMKGQVDNLRMKGAMTTRVVDGVTMTGSWDFFAK